LVAADATAERGNQRADLRRLKHFVEPRLLDVENFALERQHRLRSTIAALFRGAAGRVALDEEKLGERRVFLLAIGKLAGQTSDVERAFAPGHLARLARGLARTRGFDDL